MTIRPAHLDTATYLVGHSTTTTASTAGYGSSISMISLVPQSGWNDRHHWNYDVVLDVQSYTAGSGTMTFEVQVSLASAFAASGTTTVISKLIDAATRYRFPFDLSYLKTDLSGLGSGAHIRAGFSQGTGTANTTALTYGAFLTKA